MEDKIINPREQIKNKSDKPRGRPRAPRPPQPTKHKISYSREGLRKNEPNIENDNSNININDNKESISKGVVAYFSTPSGCEEIPNQEPVEKKGRGRPKKIKEDISENQKEEKPKFNIIDRSNITVSLPIEEKRGRGRPKKSHFEFEVIPPTKEEFSENPVEIKPENLLDCIEVREGKKHVKITLTKQNNRAVRLQIFLNDIEVRSTSFMGTSSAKNYWTLLKGIIK
jgi:hypothetical protein